MEVKKVDIFLIGSRKSGTTSLANFLDGHSEISLSTIKESNYWDKKAIERIDTLEAYHNLFDWSVPHQVDASTGYTSFPYCSDDIPQSIYDYNPSAKLIYIVRHPLKRLISHYRMSYERGDLKGGLEDALKDHPLLLECGKYFTQIDKYFKFFPREQLLILSSDQLDETTCHNRICDFLKLKEKFTNSMEKANAANYDFRMPRRADWILNNPFFVFFKSLFPNAAINYIKGIIFKSVNSGINEFLSQEGIELIRTEWISELEDLRSLIDFDIEEWMKFE